MGPFVLCTGLDRARQEQTRRELFDELLKDPREARQIARTDHDPSPYEIWDAITAIMADEGKHPIYRNELYQVQVRDCPQLDEGFPPMIWLSIRRLDREPIRDWREFQEIKNALVGPEHEGFELYPRESRLVDVSNQYHVFVFKDPQILLPVGFMSRGVSDKALSTGKQRPRSA